MIVPWHVSLDDGLFPGLPIGRLQRFGSSRWWVGCNFGPAQVYQADRPAADDPLDGSGHQIEC